VIQLDNGSHQFAAKYSSQTDHARTKQRHSSGFRHRTLRRARDVNARRCSEGKCGICYLGGGINPCHINGERCRLIEEGIVGAVTCDRTVGVAITAAESWRAENQMRWADISKGIQLEAS